LTCREALAYAFSAMSFWEDLNPSVKRYAIIGAVLVLGLIAFRSCLGPESGGAPPPPRGQTGSWQ
jgi:hypothetical protein